MYKIAVIEDEAEIRNNLSELLKLSGYEVESASNGKTGLELIMSFKPDIVLCDINMPIMDGYTLLGCLSQNIEAKELPLFLFLTARVEAEDITQGLRLGADDYLLKPYNHVELLQAVKLRLEKKQKFLRTSRNETIKNHLDKLAVPCADGFEIIEYERIVMVEAQRAYCNMHMKDGKTILVSKPMRFFEELLIQHSFIKVHKSSIVNPQHITKYVRGKGGYLLLNGPFKADVSSTYKPQVEQLLQGSNGT
ncbi:MAG: hypothetical protein Salg2KO_10910 [Salibacteraceae bacterium]